MLALSLSQSLALASLYWAVATPITSTSLIVVRVGNTTHDATAVSTGTALPVYVDEIVASSPGSTMQSFALPTSLCTLSIGSSTTHWFDTEGFPTISGNGQLVSWPCYQVQAGTGIREAQRPFKTIAFLQFDGNVDTSTSTDRPYATASATGQLAFHNAATDDGTVFWIGGAPGYLCGPCWGGYLYVNYGNTGLLSSNVNYVLRTATAPGANDARLVTVYNGRLYGTDSSLDAGWNAIFAIGSGLPRVAGSASLLPGTQGGGPWGVVFQSPSILYVSYDNPANLSYNVYQWTLNAGTWSASLGILWTPSAVTYSIAGRNESEVGFALYGATTTHIFKWVALTGATSTVATAPASSLFRGVAVAPVAPSQSLTSTPSPTLSPSMSATPTPTSTLSVGASPSPSPTSTGSPSLSGSPSRSGATSSNTRSSTRTRSTSRSNSRTRSFTRTTSRTRTNSASLSSSDSGSSTDTISPTLSRSLSSSITMTHSVGASASTTATPTSSPTPTSTSTPSMSMPPYIVTRRILLELYAEDFFDPASGWDNRVTQGPVSLEGGDLVVDPDGDTSTWPMRGTLGPVGTPAVVFNATAFGSSILVAQRLVANAADALFDGIYGDSDWSIEIWVYGTLWVYAGEVPVFNWGTRPVGNQGPCTSGYVEVGSHPQWGAGGHYNADAGCDTAFSPGPSMTVQPGSGWCPAPFVWHHVAVTFTGGSTDSDDLVSVVERVYVDGAINTEIGGRELNILLPNTNRNLMTLGSKFVSSNSSVENYVPTVVGIGAFRIHDGCLTPAEVAFNYHQELFQYAPPPTPSSSSSASASPSSSASGSASGSASPSASLSYLASASRLATRSSTWTASPLPTNPLAVAGRLLIDLRAADYDQTRGQWDNRVTLGAVSMNDGDFVAVNLSLATLPTASVRGDLSTSAVDFNSTVAGVAQYLTTNASNRLFNALYGHVPFTYEVWVYPFDLGNSEGRTPVLQWGVLPSEACRGAHFGIGYQNHYGAGGHYDCDFAFVPQRGDTVSAPNAGTALAPLRWHYVVVTYEASTGVEVMYVNGVINANAARYVFILHAPAMYIGTWYDPRYGFIRGNMAIGTLRVSTAALSAEQIAHNFAAEAPLFMHSSTPSPSRTAGVSPTCSVTLTATASATHSRTSSLTSTLSMGATPSVSASPSLTPVSLTPSSSPSGSASASGLSTTSPQPSLTPNALRWQLNGDAVVTRAGGLPGQLPISVTTRGAQSGSAFLLTPLFADRWTVHAAFEVHRATTCAAHGLTFMLQNSVAGPYATGWGQGGLGWLGIAPSVGIRFDTYSQSALSSTFGFIYSSINASLPSLGINSGGAYSGEYNVNTQLRWTWYSGSVYDVTWSYDGMTMSTVIHLVNSAGTGATAQYSRDIDVRAYVCPGLPDNQACTAYYGISAASGDGCDVEFRVDSFFHTNLEPTPSPSLTPSLATTPSPTPTATPTTPSWLSFFEYSDADGDAVVSDSLPPVSRTLLLVNRNALRVEARSLELSCVASNSGAMAVYPATASRAWPVFVHAGGAGVTVMVAGKFQRGAVQSLQQDGFPVGVQCKSDVIDGGGHEVSVVAGLDLYYTSTLWPFFGAAAVHYPYADAPRLTGALSAPGGSDSSSPSSSSILNIVVLGETNVTLYADRGTWIAGGRAFVLQRTRVYVGGVRCRVWSVSPDGTSLDFATPPYDAVCGEGATNGSAPPGAAAAVCPPATITVVNEFDFHDVAISCPPFCPGGLADIAPDPVVILPAHGAPATIGASYPVVTGALLAQQYLGGSGGVFYVRNCSTATGFTDPTLGVCTNASDPRSRGCAFVGVDGSCGACPLGAICPGGARAWPLAGFWTGLEASGLILVCAPPSAQRCVGWNGQLGVAACGRGYQAGSVACALCDNGYFPDDAGGCSLCPTALPVWNAVGTAVAFLLTLCAVALVVLGVAWCACADRSDGGGDAAGEGGGGRRKAPASSMLLYAKLLSGALMWIFLLFQVQVQVAMLGAPGLPPLVQRLYAELQLFAFQGLSVHPACIGLSIGPLALAIGQLAALALLWSVYLALLFAFMRSVMWAPVGAMASSDGDAVHDDADNDGSGDAFAETDDAAFVAMTANPLHTVVRRRRHSTVRTVMMSQAGQPGPTSPTAAPAPAGGGRRGVATMFTVVMSPVRLPSHHAGSSGAAPALPRSQLMSRRSGRALALVGRTPSAVLDGDDDVDTMFEVRPSTAATLSRNAAPHVAGAGSSNPSHIAGAGSSNAAAAEHKGSGDLRRNDRSSGNGSREVRPCSMTCFTLPSLILALQLLCVLLMITYAASADVILAMVTCDHAQVTVIQYLGMYGDGAALSRAGIPDIVLLTPGNAGNATAAQLQQQVLLEQTLVPISMLRSNSAVVCYEGQHTIAAALAWPLLFLFLLGFPLLSAVVVWHALRSFTNRHRVVIEFDGLRDGVSAAIDKASVVHARAVRLAHASPFIFAFYRPSKWWFWHVDYATLIILPGLAMLGSSGATSTTTSSLAIAVDAGRLAGVIVFAGILVLMYRWHQPYVAIAAWMSNAKYVSLLLVAITAALKLVVDLRTSLQQLPEVLAGVDTVEHAASLRGLSYAALSDAVSTLADATVVISVLLYIFILMGFIASMRAVAATRQHASVLQSSLPTSSRHAHAASVPRSPPPPPHVGSHSRSAGSAAGTVRSRRATATSASTAVTAAFPPTTHFAAGPTAAPRPSRGEAATAGAEYGVIRRRHVARSLPPDRLLLARVHDESDIDPSPAAYPAAAAAAATAQMSGRLHSNSPHRSPAAEGPDGRAAEYIDGSYAHRVMMQEFRSSSGRLLLLEQPNRVHHQPSGSILLNVQDAESGGEWRQRALRRVSSLTASPSARKLALVPAVVTSKFGDNPTTLSHDSNELQLANASARIRDVLPTGAVASQSCYVPR